MIISKKEKTKLLSYEKLFKKIKKIVFKKLKISKSFLSLCVFN